MPEREAGVTAPGADDLRAEKQDGEGNGGVER
jgi:hypothetical protein